MNPKGPLPAWVRPLAVPASHIYRWAIDRRNDRFDRGQDVTSIGLPVVSIGNITTGGTGKTPMVRWAARTLLDAGKKPVIVMRGYRARPGELSDEQAEHIDRLPEAPVIANPNRISALHEFLPAHPEIDCIVLDDGFQHRQVRRAVDLVLIDARAGTMSDRLLPAGRLREPLSSLSRADAVVVTHAEAVDDSLASAIETWHGKPPMAWTRHAWSALDVHRDSASAEPQPISWLQGKRVVTLLGIGTPGSVVRQLQSLAARIVAEVPAKDHARYNSTTIRSLHRLLAEGRAGSGARRGESCDAVVVTGKDWVKLRGLIDWTCWPVPVVVPQLTLDVFEGADALRRCIVGCFDCRGGSPRA